jgi:hypothetical protein
MTLNNLAYGLAILLGLLMTAGLVTAFMGGSLALPPDWLVTWTNWLVSAVTVAFAPIVLVTAARLLQRLAGLG